MFIWLNKQGVESDRGFAVQRTDRFTAEYRERGKVVTLDVEAGLMPDGVPCLMVDPSAFEHWDGEVKRIAADQQAQMFENLREALEFQGLKLIVERGLGPDEAPELFKPWPRSNE
ncbi:MAG TPA: hypothetical protein VN605_07220 [Thermoanaerobaculia bacterium]|nr:hypothetical protein [Thermoanaerobaculia bacterium]